MSLFDFMGDEKVTTTATNTSGMQGSTGSDESSFLIIDDSNNTSTETIPLITANDIPDSAISFFEETPVVSESVVSESIFASESPVVKEETISFFNEEPTVSETPATDLILDEEISDTIIPKTQEEDMFMNFSEETKSEKVIENVNKTETIKADPNTILIDAITDLQTLVKGHEVIIDEEMNIIEGKQAQIANLKQEIKTSTEKAKTTGEEKDKVLKMIELFQSQKI